MASNLSPPSSHTLTQASFPFLDLPQEIQERVYDKYFEDTPAVIPSPNQEVTSLNIELTSRKVMHDARKARDKLWPRILEGSAESFFDMAGRPEPKKNTQWLRNHIRGVKAKNQNFDPTEPNFGQPLDEVTTVWPRIISSCPNLRYICISHLEKQHDRHFHSNPEIFVHRYSETSTYVIRFHLYDTEKQLRNLSSVLESKFGEDYNLEVRMLVEFHSKGVPNTIQKVS